MMLQTILYGTFTPPPVAQVTRHFVGISDGRRYVAPRRPESKPADGLNDAERRVLDELQTLDHHASAHEVADLVEMTRNYANIVMASLFKKGKLTRRKVAQNGTRLYVYRVKA